MLKINVLGDSITEGFSASDEKHSFVYLLSELTNSLVNNYGVCNSGIARRIIPNDDPRRMMFFASRVKDMDHSANYVFVFGGTNDYGRGAAKIGKESDHTPETFCGGLNCLIDELLKYYKREQIIFILPLYREEENLSIPDEEGKPGHPLQYYRDLIEKIVSFNKIKVLDIKDKFGKAENNPLLADGLHPNDEGHRLIATLLADYINKELLGK